MAGSQIIVTSRYFKSGGKRKVTKRKNYVKYIATRETVEIREQKKQYHLDAASTERQNELIKELLTDFPLAKRYLECEDYFANPTEDNASELIRTIIERHADVISNRQNFVGYMALRPGAERRGNHGLFNERDEPILLNLLTAVLIWTLNLTISMFRIPLRLCGKSNESDRQKVGRVSCSPDLLNFIRLRRKKFPHSH